MPVGNGKKREVVPLRQVLLNLSPFTWQGDAPWGWNTKVPLWTGRLMFLFFFSSRIWFGPVIFYMQQAISPDVASRSTPPHPRPDRVRRIHSRIYRITHDDASNLIHRITRRLTQRYLALSLLSLPRSLHSDASPQAPARWKPSASSSSITWPPFLV